MVVVSPPRAVPALVGREPERATLRQLLTSARAGESTSLVVRGTHGLGKTALLDDFVAEAKGCLVLRAAGAESEFELPFAALHQRQDARAKILHSADELVEGQHGAAHTRHSG